MASMAPPLVTETAMGYLSLLSPDQMRKARPSCFRLFMQWIRGPFACALVGLGKRIAMMTTSAKTTITVSKRVRPRLRGYETGIFMGWRGGWRECWWELDKTSARNRLWIGRCHQRVRGC